MPEETTYRPLHQGKHIQASLADVEYILISKALKAPEKNKYLITEYLSKEANELFFSLAKKYHLNLEQFL